MAFTEEELWDMSDEDLLAATKNSEAEEQSPETEYEEEHVDDPEQPEEQDSADDLDDQNNDDEVEEDEVEDPETEDEEEDPSDESEEGQTEDEKSEDDEVKEPEEAEKEVSTEKADAQKYKFKANGQEFEFTDDEMKAQFGKVFGQAMNYTQKMQAIAPYRKMISALEEEKLTQEDLDLAIDALKGNKDAITDLVKRAQVDPLDMDLESENSYVPNSYGRDEAELRVRDVIDEISRDPEFAVTQHVVAEQWDDASREVFSQNPELIKELHIDVANGTFDKVSPMAMKMKVMDGGRKSDLDYYVEAGKQYHAQSRSAEMEQFSQQKAEQARLEAEREAEAERIRQVETQQRQRQTVKQSSKKRKAAAPTASRSGQKTATDYLDDSDEGFEDWYRKLQDSL